MAQLNFTTACILPSHQTVAQQKCSFWVGEWGGGVKKKSIPNTNHMEEVGRHICASSQKKPVYRSSTHYYNFNFPQEQVGWGLRSTQLSAENLKISTMQTNSGIPLRLSYIHHMFIVYFGSTH